MDTESLKLDPTPQMTGSNSMSSGYCSLDEESDDFTFFTAKTSFFRRPQAKQVAKVACKSEAVGFNVDLVTLFTPKTRSEKHLAEARARK